MIIQTPRKGNDMKVLKKAMQKNIELEQYYYTEEDIKVMFLTRQLFFLRSKDFSVSENYEEWVQEHYITSERPELRISTDDLKEIKVVLNEEKFYTTVAIGNNGKQYFVKL